MERKIVLTGGPCAGKTTIADVLGKTFEQELVVIPETASMLIRGGFPRWPDPICKTAFQRTVFPAQLEIESVYCAKHPGSTFLLDRGSLDGAAYWPTGAADFFAAMGTTQEAQLARYSAVIYLESADQSDYEANRLTNPGRKEDWALARSLDERTRAVWEGHSHFHSVRCEPSFADKIQTVVELVTRLLHK